MPLTRTATDLQRNMSEVSTFCHETRQPVYITKNGGADLVVMDAAAWQDMQDQLDYAETVAGIRKGLTQARAGEGVEASQFFDELARSK